MNVERLLIWLPVLRRASSRPIPVSTGPSPGHVRAHLDCRESFSYPRAETVTPICANPIWTPLCARSTLQDESFKSEVLSRTPMKRIGQPEEVAGGCGRACGPAVLQR